MGEVTGYNKGITNPGMHQQQVGRSGDIAQTGGIKPSQKVQKAVEQKAEQTAAKTQQPVIETISRRMTARDVVNQLLQMGLRATQENRALAMKMLVLGLELSKDNFSKIDQLLQGLERTSFTEQAAIIALAKGLQSKTAVQQLASFLQNNPQLSNQLNALQANIMSMQSILNGQNMLNPTLTAQLSAIMVSLEGSINAIPENLKKELREGRGLNKAELLTNMRAVKSLLTGVSKQVEAKGSVNANSLIGAMGKLAQSAKETADNLIVQAILSRPGEREDSVMIDKFSYWQIPNSLATPPQTIELLIQRDKKNKNRTLNKRKTKIILKTETPELGELAVEVDVDEDNLDMRFNTKEEKVRKLINNHFKDLQQKLEGYHYKTKSVRVVKRNLDVKKFLIPTLDLNNLTRVQAEA